MTAWAGIIGRGFTAVEFDAYVAGLPMGGWHPDFVVLHNTGNPTLFPSPGRGSWHGGKTQPAQRVNEGLVRYYHDEQQWHAGPHLFIADDLIWAFTPLQVPGVHSPSWNSRSWGVETVGDYSIEPFIPAVRENVIAALTALHRKLGLDPADFELGQSGLHFHKEDPNTTHRDCPGRNIDKQDLVQQIQQRLAA